MPAIPTTVGVDCPRCDTKIHCTLATVPGPPKPGQKTACTVPDLADRMAEHYAKAHPVATARALLGAAEAAGRSSGNAFAEAFTDAGRSSGNAFAEAFTDA